jgi:hypothetical protein
MSVFIEVTDSSYNVNTALRIGDIIADPLDLIWCNKPLSRAPPSNTTDDHITIRIDYDAEQPTTASCGPLHNSAWATWLERVVSENKSVNGVEEARKALLTKYTVRRLETLYPKQEFINREVHERLMDENIDCDDYNGRSVYMITVLNVARGFRAQGSGDSEGWDIIYSYSVHVLTRSESEEEINVESRPATYADFELSGERMAVAPKK